MPAEDATEPATVEAASTNGAKHDEEPAPAKPKRATKKATTAEAEPAGDETEAPAKPKRATKKTPATEEVAS
jgi:hypothetical protein